MNRIKGLKEYVAWPPYRAALGLPPQVTEEYTLLAQGEYNRNYLFTHPASGKKLLLRVNCGSQMHLANQIQYEYDALKLIEASGHTPVPCYVDGTLKKIPHGIMVMEFLSGHELNYGTELPCAAECLADIHSVKIEKIHPLISPKDPIKAILSECETMFAVYTDSNLKSSQVRDKIRNMLDKGWALWRKAPVRSGYKCCVNTELNSTNFLINGEGQRNYLIDWEKPIYGDPAQDLGHFLAPTTTFWKTDIILKPEEADHIISLYIRHVNGRFDTQGLRQRTQTYIPITCLRGITWCAMAWTEYQHPDKLLFNQTTFQKLGAYLEETFLNQIDQIFTSPPQKGTL